MKDGLTLRDNAKADLMQIKSIEEGMTYLNKLESVAVWVMKEKKDAELSNLVAEQKLRTQRILGELLKHTEKGQGMRTDLVPAGHEVKTKETLSDIGLSRKQSSAFQQIADIPEDTFENFIEEKKAKVNEAVKELTTAGAVRLAKSLKGNSPNKTFYDNNTDYTNEINTLLERIHELPVVCRIEIKNRIKIT